MKKEPTDIEAGDDTETKARANQRLEAIEKEGRELIARMESQGVNFRAQGHPFRLANEGLQLLNDEAIWDEREITVEALVDPSFLGGLDLENEEEVTTRIVAIKALISNAGQAGFARGREAGREDVRVAMRGLIGAEAVQRVAG